MTPEQYHPCPICATPVRHWTRYPRAVCRNCKGKATDIHGRSLSFYNIDIGGGFQAIYTDTREEYPSHTCYINGIECWADEARFGGIVIQAAVQATMTQPIKQCYWVLPGKLLAGEYPRNKDKQSSQEKLNTLLDAGVSAFIDLTEADEGLEPYATFIEAQAAHHRFAIPDVSIPTSPETVVTILDTIDHYLAHDQLVYVHCWGGVGRTGVIIGCWLARHGRDGELALSHLHELWQACPKSRYRRSPETREQEQYILNWKVGR